MSRNGQPRAALSGGPAAILVKAFAMAPGDQFDRHTHLDNPDLETRRRTRAESVLIDQLEPVPSATIATALPVEPRAREVADAVLADPADPRSLDQWGRHVAASGRTLARAFLGSE